MVHSKVCYTAVLGCMVRSALHGAVGTENCAFWFLRLLVGSILVPHRNPYFRLLIFTLTSSAW